ncbi:hypothetical protein OROMI_022661 [Orobanche minor]
MVAVKVRLNSLKERVPQEQRMSNKGQAKNFKIYVEADKVKDHYSLNNGTKGRSLPSNSGCANDSKNTIKNLEKSKTKLDKSVNGDAGRKVLADIGNVKRNFLKTEERKSCRPGKGKSDAMLYQLRKGKTETILFRGSRKDAVDSGNMDTSSSDKHSRDSIRLNKIQATDDSQTSKKSVNQNIKAKSDERRTKFEGRSAAAATGRKPVRIPLHLTRKSLPAPKHVSGVETSGTKKDNSEKSDNFRGKYGFPVKPGVISVKPSVRKSTVPKPSTLSSRVSDDFVVINTLNHGVDGNWGYSSDLVTLIIGDNIKASRAQTKVNAGVLSRKSVKPTVKTTFTSRNTQRNSTSSHIITTKKLSSIPAVISKGKQDKTSTSKNNPSPVSHEEPPLEEDISGGTVIARRKSARRNSFTCSLMSRSKLLKELGKVNSLETLPNIYDDHNHLEVCEYVDDIYQYYWVLEGQNPLLKNYMGKQRHITPQMRAILINWLVEVHLKFDLMEETLFLTVALLDRYLSLESIMKNEMQLVGLTALLLASKYEDFWHPRVAELISISAESYTSGQMLQMEKAMLKKLKFRLNEPTPYVFMLRFLKAARSDTKFEHLAFYLIELCLVEHEALNYKASLLCSSAIYVARCTMQMAQPWTSLLAKHARYEEYQIRDCAKMILKFQKAAKTSLLKVTYEKYMKLDYSRVASIKPVDKLPA